MQHRQSAHPATLMVQGTSSDAGKSVLVAGLCRFLARRGSRVAPFKPQNMSLNCAVTVDGGEIGRAQALQAQACGIAPHSDMNPVLLKPNSDCDAQVVVHGKALNNFSAGGFHEYKSIAMAAVLESHHRLQDQYEHIVVEGAGSPAEINLRENDIANMGFAEAVDCPVVLVADIDRGGVFAQLVGTLELLSDTERARVCGFIINKFRGDISLLQSGLDWVEQKTGKAVIGVVPFLNGLYLDAEDALQADQVLQQVRDPYRVIVPALSRISKHTDVDALRLHPQVELNFIGPGQNIPAADLIILPGTKNVRRDLDWLRDNGWQQTIERHLRYGGKLLGICGGFQMLGDTVDDPQGIEGTAGSSPALGLLAFATELQPYKLVREISGELVHEGAHVAGYEIHCGLSRGAALNNPLVILEDGTRDGACSADGQVAGSYLHGLFDNPASRDVLLRWAGLDALPQPGLSEVREQQLDRLADVLQQSLNMDLLFPGLKQ